MRIEEEQLKRELIGKTITDIYYSGLNSARITLFFDDNSELEIDAVGDDMAHTTISLTIEDINIINL